MHLLTASVLGYMGLAAKVSQPTIYKTPCLRWWRWKLVCTCSSRDVNEKALFSQKTHPLFLQIQSKCTVIGSQSVVLVVVEAALCVEHHQI